MKTIGVAVFALSMFAQTANPPKPDWKTTSPIVAITMPQYFIIGSSSGDFTVKISLTDGTVTYGKTYTPDAAAKAFWEAITKAYPDVVCKTAPPAR